MRLGKLNVHMQKNEVGLYLIPYTNFNSKLIKNLNMRQKYIHSRRKCRGKESFKTLSLAVIS